MYMYMYCPPEWWVVQPGVSSGWDLGGPAWWCAVVPSGVAQDPRVRWYREHGRRSSPTYFPLEDMGARTFSKLSSCVENMGQSSFLGDRPKSARS